MPTTSATATALNKGIIEAIENGIVTSTSVIVDAIAANEAGELTKYPVVSIGLHFELKEVVSVEAELERQIEKFVKIIGRQPDYIDTHKYHTTDKGIEMVLKAYTKKSPKKATIPILSRIWLGRRDSNPRMPVPKTGALPLGDVPIFSYKNDIYCTTNLLPSQQIEKASEIFHSEACVSLRHVLRLKYRLLVEPEDEANATNGSSR